MYVMYPSAITNTHSALVLSVIKLNFLNTQIKKPLKNIPNPVDPNNSFKNPKKRPTY